MNSSFIRKYSANTLIVSILLLLFSLFLIIKPVTSLNFIMILLGCITVLDGIIHIISYFSSSAEFRAFSFELVQGILGTLLGFVFIFNPQIIVSFLPFIIGAWIIVEGIIKFQFSFNIKGNEAGNWVILLLLSILTIILGFIIIFNPFGTAIAITTLAGIFLLVSEIVNIIESIYVLAKFK
ncbi:MAG: DUF308 domain-containing protein [Clostridia bacterium]|nr:DUF308 domain-containing protein [Clostridia bacterium]